MIRHALRSLALLVVALATMAGCGKSGDPFVVPPLRPTVEITFAPIERDSVSYAVRINWSGSDADEDARAARVVAGEDPGGGASAPPPAAAAPGLAVP